MIAPWRALDPRREQSVADGEAQADAKIAVMASRPAELAAWLESPTIVDAVPPPRAGGSGPNDVSVTGAVTSASAPVGGSLEWRLRVKNSGSGTVGGVVLDLQLSPNLAYGFGQSSRGSGCVAAGSSVHCELDWLGPWDDDSSADVIIGTPVTGPGEVSLAAVASYAGDDPTPEDNVFMLKANLGGEAPSASQPLTPPPLAARPVLGKPVGTPPRPLAGRMFTFTLPVTRSDTGKHLWNGTLDCDPRVGGKVIRHAESFKAGTVRMSFLVPKTASGKLLRVAVEIRSLGKSAAHTYSYTVR